MGMGPEQGGLSPFDIYFQLSREDESVAEEDIEPYNPKSIACYESITVSMSYLI